MNDLRIEGTPSTPAIHTDWNAGTVEMRGICQSPKAAELFAPVLDWIETYLRETRGCLTLNLHLSSMDDSSVARMNELFDRLETAHGGGHGVEVNWHADANAQLAAKFKENRRFPFAIMGTAK